MTSNLRRIFSTSTTPTRAVYPDEDRFHNVREMMHLMDLPHDYQLDVSKNIKANINHIAQVRFNIYIRKKKV